MVATHTQCMKDSVLCIFERDRNLSRLDIHHSFIQVRNEFAVTEKMSTYLVAFVLCDFGQSSEQTVTNNITVSVIAAKDKLEQANFALHTAVNITEHYEEYFGIRYPLPKQGAEID